MEVFAMQTKFRYVSALNGKMSLARVKQFATEKIEQHNAVSGQITDIWTRGQPYKSGKRLSNGFALKLVYKFTDRGNKSGVAQRTVEKVYFGKKVFPK